MRAPTTLVDTAPTMLPNMVTAPRPSDLYSEGRDWVVDEYMMGLKLYRVRPRSTRLTPR